MVNEDNFVTIRKQTRLALPSDDTYLYRLGVALYGFNTINSFMTEIIGHIDQLQNRTRLLDMESGKVLDIFRQTLKNIKKNGLFPTVHVTMNHAADLFEQLNTERSDFVHAYPITNKKGDQILHRRKDSKKKYFEVDIEFLDSFICRLHEVSSDLYKIRAEVRPDL
jgi:hypothetical protein